jgi:hypothetical protein
VSTGVDQPCFGHLCRGAGPPAPAGEVARSPGKRTSRSLLSRRPASHLTQQRQGIIKAILVQALPDSPETWPPSSWKIGSPERAVTPTGPKTERLTRCSTVFSLRTAQRGPIREASSQPHGEEKIARERCHLPSPRSLTTPSSNTSLLGISPNSGWFLQARSRFLGAGDSALLSLSPLYHPLFIIDCLPYTANARPLYPISHPPAISPLTSLPTHPLLPPPPISQPHPLPLIRRHIQRCMCLYKARATIYIEEYSSMS